MAILCHRWWPLQESVFFALEGEPVLDAGHALYCSTYYSRAVSVARSHRGCLSLLGSSDRLSQASKAAEKRAEEGEKRGEEEGKK
jgi:hypothetical protein